eukprot:gene1314-2532_t
MVVFGIKEEPNTKNVVVWAKGSVEYENSIKDDEFRERFKFGYQNFPSSDFLYNIFTEYMEYYLFFFGGSTFWIVLVRFSLKFLQFPVHKHMVEVKGLNTEEKSPEEPLFQLFFHILFDALNFELKCLRIKISTIEIVAFNYRLASLQNLIERNHPDANAFFNTILGLKPYNW